MRKKPFVERDTIEGSGVYCLFPFDSLDKTKKGVFKIGMAGHFDKRVKQYHTYLPQGVFYKCFLKNPSLDINKRNSINKILFYSYEKWAIKKAIEFKKFHYHKCKNIVLDDLIVASKVGLYKSVKKYNGKTTFIFFSYFYIKGELLKTLTDYFSINNIPKEIRKKSKSNYTNNELKKYKKKLNPILVSYSNYWQFDKYQNSNNINNNNFNNLIKIWN
jgi:hypothetical protein